MTDGQNCYINIVRGYDIDMDTRDKNCFKQYAVLCAGAGIKVERGEHSRIYRRTAYDQH